MSEQERRPEEPERPPRRYQDEKEEEKHEKEVDKREEKEDQTWEEKWRRDPLNAATWALILIWAGVAFLLGNWDVWESLGPFAAWDMVLLGAGVLLLIQVAIRLAIPEYRQPVMGTVILAVILVGLAFGNIIGWGAILPIILIGIGLAVLIRGLTGRG